jgi:type IV secretion system protein VirB6
MANLEIILKLLAVLGMIVLLVLQIPSVAAALGGGIALATQGIISSGMNILRPSSIQRAGRGIKREVAPFQKGWNRGKEAYKKRFGAGGSISGH